MLIRTTPIRLEAVAATVSDTIVPVEEYCRELAPPAKLRRLVKSTGFESLSVLGGGTTASDLCAQTAHRLFAEGGFSREDIGALIFISQTADYLLPGSAYVLQKSLGLSSDLVAFDVSMGCPGFVYGLYLASSLMNGLGGKKVLLCCGDARVRKEKPYSTMMGAIDGDAGACAIIGRGEGESPMMFNIESYGDRWEKLCLRAGGIRWMKAHAESETMPTLDWTRDVEMDGMAILSFTTHEVVGNIERLLQATHFGKEEIGAFLFHQPQKLLLREMADRLGVDPARVIFNSQRYGNTSLAAIPLVLAEIGPKWNQRDNKRALLSGFGVGLSVASCVLDLDDLVCLETRQYERSQL